jgi:hypothetical protein
VCCVVVVMVVLVVLVVVWCCVVIADYSTYCSYSEYAVSNIKEVSVIHCLETEYIWTY